jgi:hypothetical protein
VEITAGEPLLCNPSEPWKMMNANAIQGYLVNIELTVEN